MLGLHKSAALLCSPLGSSMLLGGFGALLQLIGSEAPRLRRLAAMLVGLSLAWLWLWSTPLASEALRGAIEDQAGTRVLAELPATEVMVVLGGALEGPRHPRRPDPNLRAAADRIWCAARLYHAGKARQLLLAGGEGEQFEGSEALAMRQVLRD